MDFTLNEGIDRAFALARLKQGSLPSLNYYCLDCGHWLDRASEHPLFPHRCEECAKSYASFEVIMEQIPCVDCGGGSNGKLDYCTDRKDAQERSVSLCGFCALPYVQEQVEILLVGIVGLHLDLIPYVLEFLNLSSEDALLSLHM